MSIGHVLVPALGGIIAVAVLAAPAAGAADGGLRQGLEALAGRVVLFGHQSVGGNVLDGLRDLAAREGLALRIAEVPDAASLPAGTLGHAYLGQNGQPESKLKAFERLLEGAPPDRPAIALMKLCFVDIHEGTDVEALFAAYQATHAALRARHPSVTFVHVTAPLTAFEGTLKALAKQALGRETQAAANARRERFNALVRQAYLGREPLFDLARLEATAPGGALQSVGWKGAQVPMLAPGYTDDGCHLNEAGRRHVAAALVAYLASLPEGPPGARGREAPRAAR